MKRFLILLALVGLAVSSGRADSVLIAFDNPNQTGIPGDTLVFTGVLSNGGSQTIFLNSDSLNLQGSSFSVTDLFLTNVPLSLDSGQSSADIELFDVTVKNPFTGQPGPYTGTYALLGGINSNAQDVVGSANFQVTVSAVPEPSSIILWGVVLVALLSFHSRIRSRSIGRR